MPPFIHLPNSVNALDLARIIRVNAPRNWRDLYKDEDLLSAVLQQPRPVEVVVLVADLRRSTQLQLQAWSLEEYAATLARFAEFTSQTFRLEAGAWFDRFTGDGFVMFWLRQGLTQLSAGKPQEIPPPRLRSILGAVSGFSAAFQEAIFGEFESLVRSVPAGAGLALGVDGGLALFAEVAGELTIVGAPLAGATRMVDMAHAGEVVINNYVGNAVWTGRRLSPGVRIQREVRFSPDFPMGQEVYLLSGRPEESG
jgi:class 3 adenylate cyclase